MLVILEIFSASSSSLTHEALLRRREIKRGENEISAASATQSVRVVQGRRNPTTTKPHVRHNLAVLQRLVLRRLFSTLGHTAHF